MWKQYDDHTHVHAPEVHTWDTSRGGARASSLFGFVPSVSVAIPPPYGRRTIAPSGGVWEERPRHSRPAEKFVLVASDINIFGTLPNWQGKLFVRPTDQPGESDWAFSGPGLGC